MLRSGSDCARKGKKARPGLPGNVGSTETLNQIEAQATDLNQPEAAARGARNGGPRKDSRSSNIDLGRNMSYICIVTQMSTERPQDTDMRRKAKKARRRRVRAAEVAADGPERPSLTESLPVDGERAGGGGACCRDLGALMEPRFFKALGDANRIALLAGLSRCCAPVTVGEIARCCPVDVSVVSRHLAMLREVGILEARKHGKEVHYAICYTKLATTLRALADAIDACCPPTDPETEKGDPR